MCGLFVKMTSFPLLRNFDVFFTCEYIFTGHFPTCNYIVDSFTCEEDIISVLEEFWCFFYLRFFCLPVKTTSSPSLRNFRVSPLPRSTVLVPFQHNSNMLPKESGVCKKNLKDLRNESNIFSVDQCINQKKMENCINVVAHCCKNFPFCFRLIPRSTEKILDLFLIISFSFHFNKEIGHSNSYKHRIISNFWCRRDTYDVTIQFFGWCRNYLNFLTNQNKC